MTLRDRSNVTPILTADDRIAVLVAIHHADRGAGAREGEIRAQLSSVRLPGGLLGAALKRLHGEALVLAVLRGGWSLTADGWAAIVSPLSSEPEALHA